MPMPPVITNDPRQPTIEISHATSGSDSAEPTREPLSKMLLASPRSLRGNQLNATFANDGIAAASPTPSISRTPTSCARPRAAPVATVNTDHQPTASARLTRTPTLSMNQPAGNCRNA
ncbi:hypothetical protein CSX04_06566 [Burkholderia cepacia]|nr:hypothetical protein CSX04_06566 [Burkholderia cepacia]